MLLDIRSVVINEFASIFTGRRKAIIKAQSSVLKISKTNFFFDITEDFPALGLSVVEENCFLRLSELKGMPLSSEPALLCEH